MTRHYESIILFDSALTEPQLEEQVERVSKLFNNNQAQNLKVDHWGRREIAFQLKESKKRSAFYVCFYYETENTGIVESLNEMLRINDSVLMYQTHRIAESVRKFQGRTSYSESDQDAI